MIKIRLYQYRNYKDYVNDWIRSQPNHGRGKYLEISKYLSIHTTLTSQIFKGQRDLNDDQAFKLSQYFGFGPIETDYFLTLIQKEKAANFELKEFLEVKIKNLAIKLDKMKHRLKKDITLDENQKALFYSNWIYSATRLICSLDEINTKEDIATFLSTPMSKISPIVDFLLSVSLIKEESDKLTLGPTITHLDASSPLIVDHHRNWRIKAMNRHENISQNEFCFSGPLTINSKDAEKVKNLLKETIEKLSQIVQDSEKSDSLYCVNLDWFHPISEKP